MTELEKELRSTIRDVADFPKPGILFKDITPVLQNPTLSVNILKTLKHKFQNLDIEAVVGVESRGFFYGFPLALEMEVPFIPIRKKGKLPYKTIAYSYDLEYGSATVEMHEDVIKPGMRVLIHDDLLATGGTAIAAAELIKKQGGVVVAFSFLVELEFLNGKQRLMKYCDDVDAVTKY